MTTQNQPIEAILHQIENKLFDMSKAMSKPTLDADLSVLMFEAAFYKYSGNEVYKEKALVLLNNLFETFQENELRSGFLEGFEGAFWVMDYLKECGIIDDVDALDDLLPYCYKSIEINIATNNFDLLHGIINKLQYLIKYLGIDHEKTSGYIDGFIDAAYGCRQETELGIFWYDELGDKDLPGVNLGFAHGLPSLLVFLTRLKTLGYQKKELDLLIEGVIKALQNFKFKIRSDSNYPDIYYVGAEIEHIASRLGFCYGDLGIAYAFSYVGVHLKKDDLVAEAQRITHNVCRRLLSNSGMVYYEDYHFFDTSFCHGLSGVVYILAKINTLLPSKLLDTRIDFWKKELVHHLNIQLAIQGEILFPSYLQPDDSNPYAIDQEAFLMGYTGTGLVLLSAYYNQYKNDWGDVFLFF